MDLGHVEEPTGLDEVGHHSCPAGDVRQPAEDAVRGVDDIELAVQLGRQVIQVGDHEGCRNPELGRQGPRGRDALRTEVGTRHDRSHAGPGEAVQAEVALQVEERLALDRSDLGELVVGQPN